MDSMVISRSFDSLKGIFVLSIVFCFSLESVARVQLERRAPFNGRPDELIVEIISHLPVKTLIRFRCLNKSFNTLISDPNFVKIHLKKSERNQHLAVFSYRNPYNKTNHLLTFPVSSLHGNSSITIHYDPCYQLNHGDGSWVVVGSCNGLLCLLDRKASPARQRLCLWNPATRTKSEFVLPQTSYSTFFLGYYYLTETYKVVAFRVMLDMDNGNARGTGKVLSIGNSSWRDIQCLQLPLYWFGPYNNGSYVYLNGTINWLALQKYLDEYSPFFNDGRITVDEIVIVSLDLSTESHTQLKNGDTLILASYSNETRYAEATMYNCRDNTTAKIGITNKILWLQLVHILCAWWIPLLGVALSPPFQDRYFISFRSSNLSFMNFTHVIKIYQYNTLAESSVYMRQKIIVDTFPTTKFGIFILMLK
ncbi:F-box protein interaction domain protein [Medicago truncatula]|uniref:F-box protein interaction domain protein n=1 Tax=Medicago truncatula TaxID=3880 RepID=G7JFT7_MEDTR|nr:F-box protein interaction domain protein [Medicago truncatula]